VRNLKLQLLENSVQRRVLGYIQGVRKKSSPVNWIFSKIPTKNSINPGTFFRTTCIKVFHAIFYQLDRLEIIPIWKKAFTEIFKRFDNKNHPRKWRIKT